MGQYRRRGCFASRHPRARAAIINKGRFVDGLPEGGKLDLAALGLPALSMRVRVGRNLKEFPLPGAMSKEDRVNLEAKMKAAFAVLIAKSPLASSWA